MSNEVVKINNQEMTADQLKLIKSTIAKNATNDELQLFLYRAKSMGLDPLKPGQIYFMKYGPGAGTIVIGIDGFRAIAQRTGKLSGIRRGVTRDEHGKLVSAWAEIHRSDWQHPAREEVPFAEYSTGKSTWVKMPETMLKKCAEAAALRMAFPDDLGGVYESTEMDQADRGVYPEQPAATDGVQTGEYECPSILQGKFGVLRKKKISQADPVLLREAVIFIEEKATREGKDIPEWAQEFIHHAEPFILDYENKLPDSADLSVKEPGSFE